MKVISLALSLIWIPFLLVVGDLLEMEGHYVENLIRSVEDVRVDQNNTKTGEKVLTLTDEWYVRTMNPKERHKVQS